jgi:hypothetical protein
VARLAQHRLGSAELATCVEQLCRVEEATAVVTLVPSSIVTATLWARSNNEAVGEEPIESGGVELLSCVLLCVTSGMDGCENVLRDLGLRPAQFV